MRRECVAFESAHMTVRLGKGRVQEKAAECIRITKEKDTHTLRYDWFPQQRWYRGEVREGTRSGRTNRAQRTSSTPEPSCSDYADNHFMTVYGAPTPELIDPVKASPERQFKWFSFVKGS